MVVLGGSGRWLGSILGVLTYLTITEGVRFVPGIPSIITGGVTTMIFAVCCSS